MANKDDEIIHHGPVTEYRPHKDDVSGGRDKSVQTEALGAEGIANLSNSSATSGGAFGETNSIDDAVRPPKRDGGLSPDDEPQPAGDRGNLTR